MGYSKKRTSEDIAIICEHLIKKDELWVSALWELTDYLVNIEFSKRCLAVSKDKAWDATTDIFMQIKQRIDCKERINKNGVIIKPSPIENIVSYTYFALPKRFNRWCAAIMTVEERDRELVRLETYNPSDKSYTVNLRIEQELSTEMTEPEKSFDEIEKTVIEWLGKASNNVELKNRRAKLKAQGWEVLNGHLIQITLSEKEMARELAVLESEKENLALKEERRVKRIKYLKGELYGKH